MRSEMECWGGNRFSEGYFTTRLPRNWHQKLLRENKYLTWLVEQRIVQRTCKWLPHRGYRVLGDSQQESKRGAMSLHVTESFFTWKIAWGRKIFLQTGNKGSFLSKELVTNKIGIAKETVETFLEVKHPPDPPPLFYVVGVWQNTYVHSCGYYGRCGQIGCA